MGFSELSAFLSNIYQVREVLTTTANVDSEHLWGVFARVDPGFFGDSVSMDERTGVMGCSSGREGNACPVLQFLWRFTNEVCD